MALEGNARRAFHLQRGCTAAGGEGRRVEGWWMRRPVDIKNICMVKLQKYGYVMLHIYVYVYIYIWFS